jgi:hypothetical protein
MESVGHVVLRGFGAILGGRGRPEKLVLRHVLEVVGARDAHISHDVVDRAIVGRRGLHLLHPRVLCEAGGNNHVLILQHCTRRDGELLGQLEDDVRLGNRPTLDELPGAGISFGSPTERPICNPQAC